jgi:hypothetical protein
MSTLHYAARRRVPSRSEARRILPRSCGPLNRSELPMPRPTLPLQLWMVVSRRWRRRDILRLVLETPAAVSPRRQ